jgi:CubicO group peptidase (beta-lactamase class C family)
MRQPHDRYVVVASSIAMLCLTAAPTLAAQLPRTRAEVVGMSTDRVARMRPAMQAFVDSGDVAGVVTLIARGGRIVAIDTVGYADLESKRAMRSTTIFRIASMTKAVTSVAVMMLVEEGRIHLNDPLGKYLPAFDSVRVAVADSVGHATATTSAPKRRITVHDLLTHRSGLAYGFIDAGVVGDAYRKVGISDGIAPTSGTIGENVDKLARQPLDFDPGAKWQYSLATDVLGRVVEVVSRMPLDRFFRERIFAPLKMNDTDFYVPDEKLDRLAVPYTHDAGSLRRMSNPEKFFDGRLVMGGPQWRGSRTYFSGGAGLFSTAGDYARFLQMLLNGGELDGARLLSPKTVELMTASATNDLGPDAVDHGVGFGLGFGILSDVGAHGAYGSVGNFSWGGIYGSDYFVDPKEQMIGVMMVQLFPDRAPISETFEAMAYQAITRAGAPRETASPRAASRTP